jgi:endonuclease-3
VDKPNLNVEEVYKLLSSAYPDVKSKLLEDMKGVPMDCLIATILSQATNDTLSGKAFLGLKGAFSTWDEVLSAEPSRLEEVLRPGGLYKEKAQTIKAVLRRLKDDFGEITLDPLNDMTDEEAFKYLTSLKGVGPKTAACVLGFGFGRPAFPVDTHVLRLARRMGLVPPKVGAAKAQQILEEMTPAHLKMPLHITLIEHGRRTCHARNPKCEDCPLRGRCTPG